MEVFNQGLEVIKYVVLAIGSFTMVLGLMHWFEGYTSDNPGSKASGAKQIVAGAGIVGLALLVIPLLREMFPW